MLVMQKYYEDFVKAVEKRLTDNCAIPVSGGLDSTLIVKAVVELGQADSCLFLTYGDSPYVKLVEEKYGVSVHRFSCLLYTSDAADE